MSKCIEYENLHICIPRQPNGVLSAGRAPVILRDISPLRGRSATIIHGRTLTERKDELSNVWGKMFQDNLKDATVDSLAIVELLMVLVCSRPAAIPRGKWRSMTCAYSPLHVIRSVYYA